jgi:hypothetical protein
LALALLLIPPPAAAQDDFIRRSPCVLETVFPIGDPTRWKRVKSMQHFSAGTSLGFAAWPNHFEKETSIPEWYALGRYACDGVSLREEVKNRGTEWEEPGLRISELLHMPTGKYQVTLEATLFNPKGNSDRLVTLAYDVLDSNKQSLQTATRSYKLVAKAKSGENADALLLFMPDELKRVAALRLTITTKPY